MAKVKKKVGILLGDADLKRRYPDSALASTIYLDEDRDLRLPCRVLSINHHLGGGIPYGKIIEILGEESTGKTLLAIDFGAVAQSLGGVVLWDDAEASFDPKWMKKHGLDLKKIQLLPYENVIEIVSDWIADMCIYWRNKLTKNEPILLVIDSIALLESMDAMDTAEQDSKAEMGRRSFKMGQMLRKRTKIFAKYGICVLFINQLRTKIGASQFEDPNTTPLAQCMKYYASQRLGLFRGKRLRKGGGEKGKWVGNEVYLRTKKNKTSPPRDNVKAKVYFVEEEGNLGYNKYYGFADLLADKGVIERVGGKTRNGKKEGGKFYYKGELIGKGEEEFQSRIATDAELRKKLIKRLGVNTPSKLRLKLESAPRNLFPVKLKVKSDE